MVSINEVADVISRLAEDDSLFPPDGDGLTVHLRVADGDWELLYGDQADEYDPSEIVRSAVVGLGDGREECEAIAEILVFDEAD